MQLFERSESKLTIHDREKVLTIRPLIDEIVPTSTVTIKNAKNIRIPCIEHALSITAAMTIFSKSIITFLKEA